MRAVAASYRARLSQDFTEAAQSSVAVAVLLLVVLEVPSIVAFSSYLGTHAPILVLFVPLLLWPVPLSLYVLYQALVHSAKSARVQRVLFFFGLVGAVAACLAGLWAFSYVPGWNVLFPVANLVYVLLLLRMLYTGHIDERVVSSGDAARGEIFCVVGVSVTLFLFLLWYVEVTSPFLLFSILVSVTPVLGDTLYRLLRFSTWVR